MGLKKCCVGGCGSTNKTHRLFSFPKNDYLRKLWLFFLEPHNSLLIGLSKEQLIDRRVCEKHFDATQFDGEGKRLRYSYPCLFTAIEIKHNVPLAPEFERPTPVLDHNYMKKQHYDHTYHKDASSFESSTKDDGLKDQRPTGKRKWDEIDDQELTYDDIDTKNVDDGSVEVEPEDNYFAIDHELIQDDFDNAIDLTADGNEIVDEDVQITGQIQCEQDTPQHNDIKCNVCHGEVIGFRYSCLQCVDWDMCTACEARGEHATHYVLRIPAPVTHLDSEPVLAAIREQIQNLLLLNKEIKSEIYLKEETDMDEETVDYDPDMTDPILVENERSVPALNMCEESSTQDDVNDISKSNSQVTDDYCDMPILDSSELNILREFLVPVTSDETKQIMITVDQNVDMSTLHELVVSLNSNSRISNVKRLRLSDDNR